MWHIQHKAKTGMPSSSSVHIFQWCKASRRCLETRPTSSKVNPCNLSLLMHDIHRDLALASYFHHQKFPSTSKQVHNSKMRTTSRWTRAKVSFVVEKCSEELWCCHEYLECSRQQVVRVTLAFDCLLQSSMKIWLLKFCWFKIQTLIDQLTFSKVAKALSFWPHETWYLADSGSQGVRHAKTKSGAADKPSNQRHPRFGTTAIASTTSKHAPSAQKQSSNTTHLPRCFVGKNSAYKVTDCGTAPIAKPTSPRKSKSHPRLGATELSSP